MRKGLSSDCTLEPMIVLAIMMGGREHPCDRCNMDREKCRGYPRLDEQNLTSRRSRAADTCPNCGGEVGDPFTWCTNACH